MEVSQHIIDQAELLLKKGVALPAGIAGAPGFFLSTHEDSTVYSFCAIEYRGLFYKIGVKKVK